MRIPGWMKTMKLYPFITKHWAIVWAITSIVQASFIYTYDVYSDYAVIEDIQHTRNNFRIPQLSVVDPNFKVMSQFADNMIKDPGAASLKEPCTPIQSAENVLRSQFMGYDIFLYGLGNVRFLGNKSHHDASDVAELFGNLYETIDYIYKSYHGRHVSLTSASFPLKSLGADIRSVLNEIESKIPETSFITWLAGKNNEIKKAKKTLKKV